MFNSFRIEQQLEHINRKIDKLMSALDDLNTAVANLTVSINAEITALNTALSNSDQAGIESAVTNLNNLNAQLQSSIPAPVVAQAVAAKTA